MILLDHNAEKIQNAVIFFAKKTKHCGITKLLKLLYYLDFIHFRQTGKSVTGQEYYAWDWGPVPPDVYFELSKQEDRGLGLEKAARLIQRGDRFQEVVARARFNPDFFSERELKILNEVAEIFRDAQADLMVEATHLINSPWDMTLKQKGSKALIDYELAIDGSPDQLDEEIIKERQAEIKEMHQLFRE